MKKIRIFGGYCKAEKQIYNEIKLSVYPIIRSASNLAEAIGLGIAFAKEQCPIDDGWEQHVCDMVEVPPEHVK